MRIGRAGKAEGRSFHWLYRHSLAACESEEKKLPGLEFRRLLQYFQFHASVVSAAFFGFVGIDRLG